jgi:integrase/recombinase XerD
LERFFKNPHTLSCRREDPLGHYLDEFAQRLSEKGYSWLYGRRQLQLAAELSHWLRKKDLAVADLKVADLEKYLKYRSRSVRVRRGDAANLKAFYEVLCQKGLVVERVAPVPKTPIEELQDEYSLYLREERALAPTTVIGYLPFSRELLRHRFGTGPIDLSELRAADVLDFVQHRAPLLIRKQAKKMTTVLRSFLQYARYHNYIRTDLAACVPCVADWSATSIPPKGLPFQDVKAVLASCNRQRAVDSLTPVTPRVTSR